MQHITNLKNEGLILLLGEKVSSAPFVFIYDFLFFIFIDLPSSFFFFFALLHGLQGSKFPDQGSNPCPQQWKHRILNTGPPGNSLASFLFLSNVSVNIAVVIYLSIYISMPLRIQRANTIPYHIPQIHTHSHKHCHLESDCIFWSQDVILSISVLSSSLFEQFYTSSTPAWKIPWMEEPGRLQSMGSLRVGHDLATSFSLFTFMHWRRKWQPTPVFLPGESQGWGSLVGCRLWGHTESDTNEVT